MRKIFLLLSSVAAIVSFTCCNGSTSRQEAANPRYVTVADGEFYIGDSVYRYVGTNLWYGAILASEKYGDRERLSRELDTLQALGIDNLRILVGGDGNRRMTAHIEPNLQIAPGVYNDTLLAGLDYLLAELERRDMKAVLYLTNSWEWSGGYGTYLEWAGEGVSPVPSVDGYNTYVDFVSKFVLNDSAKAMYANHVRNIVGRTNSLTGKPYVESPAIMSWQISNEPRAFSKEGKEAFADWIISTGNLIHELDSNHLVSTGSEGLFGCEVDLDLWKKIHSSDAIDYANIHIWPTTWRWASNDSLTEHLGSACSNSLEYIKMHVDALKGSGKPIVLEEFGYPRDGKSYDINSTVSARDAYYKYVFELVVDSAMVNGANFWGWAGFAVPEHETWQAGDVYAADPAQEPQGLFSVFVTDSTTTAVISDAARKISRK
ncbi:MAG: beta-mannosidase [Muribaculaceae bacterium]|nr:beta-mannosidase [Muribaculaceae bacterium]